MLWRTGKDRTNAIINETEQLSFSQTDYNTFAIDGRCLAWNPQSKAFMSLQTKWHSIAHWHFSLFFSSVITACTHRSFQNNAPRKARNVPLSDIYEGTVSTTYRLLPVQHWMPSASQSFNENRRWANFSQVLSREKLHVNPQNYNSVWKKCFATHRLLPLDFPKLWAIIWPSSSVLCYTYSENSQKNCLVQVHFGSTWNLFNSDLQ